MIITSSTIRLEITDKTCMKSVFFKFIEHADRDDLIEIEGVIPEQKCAIETVTAHDKQRKTFNRNDYADTNEYRSAVLGYINTRLFPSSTFEITNRDGVVTAKGHNIFNLKREDIPTDYCHIHFYNIDGRDFNADSYHDIESYLHDIKSYMVRMSNKTAIENGSLF